MNSAEHENALVVVKSMKDGSSLQKVLEAQGYTTFVLANPIQVLTVIKTTNFKFAFIEHELEGMQGADLAYQIKIKNPKSVIALLFPRVYDASKLTNNLKKAHTSAHFHMPIAEQEILEFIISNKIEGSQSNLDGEDPKTVLRTSVFIKKMSNADLIQQIPKMQALFQDKNHFEILGIEQDFSQKEVQKSYRDLSKMYHPDLLQSWMGKEDLEIARHVFTTITAAYVVLSNEDKRKSYEYELKHGSINDVLSNEALIEQGRSFLKQNNFPAALEKFTEAAMTGEVNVELNIYCLWAQIEMVKMDNVPGDLLTVIWEAIEKIAELKLQTPEFFYLMGLYHASKQDNERALQCFQEAVRRKPSFMEAQRKIQFMNAVQTNASAPQGFFSRLFGRKKSS